jgi:hypothetical protein
VEEGLSMQVATERATAGSWVLPGPVVIVVLWMLETDKVLRGVGDEKVIALRHTPLFLQGDQRMVYGLIALTHARPKASSGAGAAHARSCKCAFSIMMSLAGSFLRERHRGSSGSLRGGGLAWSSVVGSFA